MFSHRIDDKLQLRLLVHEHASQFFDLAFHNRRHIAEWMFWIDENFSRSEAEEHIQKSLERLASHQGFEAGIWFEDQLAGCIKFHYFDWEHRNTEIGFWLGAKFQGSGTATRACAAMVNHAFRELGMHRVEMRCMSENVRSRRIPQRLNFVEEGLLRRVRWRMDHFDDQVIYGMLAAEWQG
jgi:ribosomal-protein-serine acetyltransferase